MFKMGLFTSLFVFNSALICGSLGKLKIGSELDLCEVHTNRRPTVKVKSLYDF